MDLTADAMFGPGSTAWYFGVFLRLVGLAYCGACGMLAPQVLALAGHRGMQPAQARIRRIEADLPAPRRYVLFPSWLFLFGSLPPRLFDRVLVAGLYVGALAGALVALGLGDSRIWLAVCWSIYLSYANMVQLVIYPWDYLLGEIGFLAVAGLPRLEWLGESVSLASNPAPLVTLYFRFLLFRLMFGFGRIKFSGASTKEFSYLKGFMINQPLPTSLGWLIHGMPLVVHHVGLFFFFVAEIIVPFGFFLLSGWARAACGLGTIFLQANIQMTGNFGFFNMLSAVLSVVTLDGRSVFLNDFAWSDVTAEPITHLLFGCILFPLTLFFLLFNSWVTASFVHWPSINLPVTGVGKFLRTIANWHMIHAYGIFFAHSSPAIRWVPIIEGTDEEVEVDASTGAALSEPKKWEAYHYHYMTVSPSRRPPFVAPFHYRFDQSIFYDSVGMMPDTLMASLSSGNPYDFHGNGTNLELVAQRLLLDQDRNEESPIEQLFQKNPFPAATRPVKALRIALYLYQPTTLAEMRATGRYWKVKHAGPQVKAVMTRASLLRAQLAPGNSGRVVSGDVTPVKSFYRLREPSLWHPDHYLWQTESTLFQGMARAYEVRGAGANGRNLNVIVSHSMEQYTDWEPRLCQTLWSEFLPRVRVLHQRLVATTDAAKRISEKAPTRKAGACPCTTCQLHDAWSAKGSKPALDWSSEMTQLRSSLLDAGTFTPSELFFFQLLVHRLTLLLTNRVLAAPGLYSAPHVSESNKQTEQYDLDMKAAEAKHLEEARACTRASSTGRLPAPTWAANFGLLPKVTGPRGAQPPLEPHLMLPSFFHLHLFLMHSLLSCEDEAQLAEMLARPELLVRFMPSFSVSTGLVLPGLFQLDLLRFHASKARLTQCITFPAQRESGGLLPGFLSVLFNFLPWQFQDGATDPPALPQTVRRPTHAQDFWRIDWANMRDPTVDLN